MAYELLTDTCLANTMLAKSPWAHYKFHHFYHEKLINRVKPVRYFHQLALSSQKNKYFIALYTGIILVLDHFTVYEEQKWGVHLQCYIHNVYQVRLFDKRAFAYWLLCYMTPVIKFPPPNVIYKGFDFGTNSNQSMHPFSEWVFQLRQHLKHALLCALWSVCYTLLPSLQCQDLHSCPPLCCRCP